MRALVLISVIAIIHTSSSHPAPDLDKLAEHAALKLHEVKHHLKEKAVEHIHKIVEGLDLEKLKKLDFLNLLKPKHFEHGLEHLPHLHHEKHHLDHIHHEKHLDHIHHEKHLDHIHHEKHLDHIHHEGLFEHLHHKEPLFIDPHQIERVKYYFEQEHHKE